MTVMNATTQKTTPNYQGASTEAIQYHYDVGNEFYKLWLDPNLTYSCALWEEGEEYADLETAQLRKLDYHIEQTRAKNAKRVLDVGCGWGSLLKRLVEAHGVEKAIGLSLSQAQLDWIQSFDNPQIETHLENWCDHSPEEHYDAIISLGAFEHFAKGWLSESEKIESYRAFFQRCYQWLKPGGWMSLQTNIVQDSKRWDAAESASDDNFFPESSLPHLAEIVRGAEETFEIVSVRNDRQDYERTVKAWLKNLKRHRTEAIAQVGEEIFKRYIRYLGLSSMAFYQGTINLTRIVFRRLERPEA